MKLARLMRTVFAEARSSSVATQVEGQEPTKRDSMRIPIGLLTLIILGLLIASIASPKAGGAAKPAPGPTVAIEAKSMACSVCGLRPVFVRIKRLRICQSLDRWIPRLHTD